MDFKDLEDLGYLALFIYTLGGGFFGLATAVFFSTLGKMSFIVCILVAGFSNFVGSSFLYFFAKKSKKDVLSFFKNHKRKLALAHLLIKKYGAKVIFIQKFIYGVKTVVPLAIGITKYSQPKFLFLNFLAAFIWAIAVGSVVYMSGGAILKLLDYVENYPWIAPLMLITVLGTTYLYLTKATKK